MSQENVEIVKRIDALLRANDTDEVRAAAERLAQERADV
jgi:hypothetical protein